MSTLDAVLEAAQEEAGHTFHPHTTATAVASHLMRFRQTLVNRLATAWEGATSLDVIVPIPTGLGWGASWGLNWGGGLSPTPIGPLAAIWRVEARHVASGRWDQVTVTTAWDVDAQLDPALILRDRALRFVRFSTVWLGVYDQVKLLGVPVPASAVDLNAIVEPNALLGRGFERCLVLEGARYLAICARDATLARLIADELREVQLTLLGQARAHVHSETSREKR